MSYKHIEIPLNGTPITIDKKKLSVPDFPIIPFIEGDGIGRDITDATRKIVDAAVAKVGKGRRCIVWM